MSLLESIRPSVVYHPTRALDDLPSELRLRNVEWGLLFAVTGEHTVAQVGEHLGLEPKVRDRAFARLVELGLVRERELDLEEYLRAVASVSDDLPRSLAQFLQAGALRPRVSGVGPARSGKPKAPRSSTSSGVWQKPKSLKELAEEPDLERTRAVPVGRPTARPKTSLPPAGRNRFETGTFEPLATPLPKPPASPGNGGTPSKDTTMPGTRLSLRAVMQHILDRAADLNTGQLDIYRVFIRVDTKLLRRNGITTLRFEDDRLIGDRELQEAITGSLSKTLGLDCPAHAYQ